MSNNPIGRGDSIGGAEIPGIVNPLGRGSGVPVIRRRRGTAPDRVIPNARIDSTGQLGPAAGNALANDPARNQLMVASLDSIIPILYGGPERIAGKIYVVKVVGNLLYLALILCEGEVEQIGSAAGDNTNGIFVNDVDLAGATTLAIHKYLGTSGQAADSWLTAAITSPVAYAETLADTAYVVLQIPAGAFTGFPRVVCTVKGRKVYDPRQNLLPFSNTWSSWTQVGTCGVAQTGTGPWGATNYTWVLTDSDAAAHSARTIAIAIASSSNSYVWFAKIRKASGGTSPTVRIDVNMAGGTPVASTVFVNADTGATSGGTGVTAVEVGQTGDRYWLVSGTITDNASGNTALGIATYPAVNTFGNLSNGSVATTGSNTFGEAGIRLSTVPAGYVETGGTQHDQPTQWSDNPALCLGDFLASTSYGEGRNVNEASLAAAAEYCDEMLGTSGEPNEKRSQFTLLLDSRQPVRAWRDILRSYVPCWVAIDAGQAVLRLDRDEAVDHTFTTANIRQQPLISVSRGGLRDTPNAVVVSFTDTSVTPHKTSTVEVNTGASPRRVTRVDMPGLRSYSRARRFGTLRLNHYTLEDLTASVPVFDEGLKVLDGDLVQITDASVGLSSQKARVLSAQDEGHGRWMLGVRKHDAAVFTNAVVAVPTSPSTSPPDPNAPPAVAGLALYEDRRLESGVWVSRIRATWNPLDSTWPFVNGYIVELFDVATNATYTQPSAGVVEIASVAHGLNLNDFFYADWTSGALSIDGGFSVTNVPSANAFRTTYAGSGASGNVTWRKMREHHVLDKAAGTVWLSQPVVLGVNYSVRVRVRSITGVVGS